MKTLTVLSAFAVLLGLSACASSNAKTVRLSNVWSTTCVLSGQNVAISAPTLAEFHAAVEQAPECARGYTATPPSQ
ncbi:hypothetical protein [Magnetospirillum molischianum]|uniref:Lipoprotein n=1 Tax=Magnetospirillum molischianum DSM 120 TaxID=1150626 RepID=H8FQ89_MAGML|nr:hypothetical protein [Magnetospirillum molischianum]CCG40527.1 conserved exported hypothetical protein [Magnetospirillum molischianum DSM 120]